MQDALLHAYAGFRTFQEGTNLKSWLIRILYNRWISTHRAVRSRPTEFSVGVVTDQDLAFHPSRQPEGSRSAEVVALDMLFDSEIRAAMDTLPEGYREVLYFTLVQGYTSARTAALLGLPMGTVMSRLSRGRQRLRIALAPHHGRSTHSRAVFSTMISHAVS